ncbi:MAG: peptidylprolyl isomerase [Planctomycetota bacterium]
MILRIFLLLIALIPLMAAGGAVAEDRPEYDLKLTVEEGEIDLGKPIPFTVTLAKRKGKAHQVNALRLARNSVSLRVDIGGKKRTITRIYGQVQKSAKGRVSVRDDKPPMQELKRGHPLELELPVLAIRTGELTFRALYTGLPKGKGPAILKSGDVVVKVVAPEGKKEIAARMVTSEGEMVFTFNTDATYNTTLNFLTLAKAGRYEGLTFHRIVADFMAQGGDPKGNGTGGPGYCIHREIDATVKHDRGVLSMARSEAPNSGGSQFFVMFGPRPSLDGAYAAFGKMVEGKKTLEALEAVETDPRSHEKSRPIQPPVIRKVEVITR